MDTRTRTLQGIVASAATRVLGEDEEISFEPSDLPHLSREELRTALYTLSRLEAEVQFAYFERIAQGHQAAQ